MNTVSDLSSGQIERILQGISIPPQPQIMVDLQMEQIKPNYSLQAIAKLISQDVGLSGSILKTINSPFYGLCNKITSINQAVNLLGAASVINLINAYSIRSTLSDENIVALNIFWDSSTEIAMASTVIAKSIGFPSQDEAYTLGLFHNCGIPLLTMRFENYTDLMSQAYQKTSASVTSAENTHIKTNHAVVGYYVAKAWNLPEHICSAIYEHHDIEEALSNPEGDAKKKTLLAILKMAEHICGNYRIIGHQQEDHEWQRISELLLIYIGLTEYELLGLQDQITDLGLGKIQPYR